MVNVRPGLDRSKLPPHGITIWTRDLTRTRWAWSCRCGARYRADLPDHAAARAQADAHSLPAPPTPRQRLPAPYAGPDTSCPGCYQPHQRPANTYCTACTPTEEHAHA